MTKIKEAEEAYRTMPQAIHPRLGLGVDMNEVADWYIKYKPLLSTLLTEATRGEKVEGLKPPYKIVEHSWEETSIYNAHGNRVCLFNLNDFGDVTEENQDELEAIMGKEIDAIVHALNNYKETP